MFLIGYNRSDPLINFKILFSSVIWSNRIINQEISLNFFEKFIRRKKEGWNDFLKQYRISLMITITYFLNFLEKLLLQIPEALQLKLLVLLHNCWD